MKEIGFFSLRNKLIIFCILLAMLPLGFAGRALLRITRDELKSSANEEIMAVAEEVSRSIDATYSDIWLAPLRLIADSLTSGSLDPVSIKSLLQTGVTEIPGVQACRIRIQNVEAPLRITRDDLSQNLETHGLNADVLFGDDLEVEVIHASPPFYQEQLDQWFMTITLPLPDLVPDRMAWLTAGVELSRITNLLDNHLFNQRGSVLAVDATGRRLFDPDSADMTTLTIVREAVEMLKGETRAIEIKPYQQDSGQKMLAGYSGPNNFDWAVILQQDEEVAYRALRLMDRALWRLALIGMALAVVAAVLFAFRISKPVEEIARVASDVEKGELDTRVSNIRSRDEIALLGKRMNSMIEGLRERDFVRETFGRYVTPEVADRVLSDPKALEPGGDLRTVTILMSDLRGFTSLSEQLEPAEMVDLLNAYLGEMATIISDYGGTVIEFIGDAVMALFGAPEQGENDPLQAVAAAAHMQIELERFNAEHPDIPELHMGIGINTGPVIVGNIGSEKRMKYGVVGDDVNLTARVESFTIGGEVMVSRTTHDLVGDNALFRGPIEVSAKGKKEKLELFALVTVQGPYDLPVPHEHKARVVLDKVSIPVKFNRIAGKEVSEIVEDGTLTGLAGEEAEMLTGKTFAAFDNIKCSFFLGSRVVDEVYAKIIEVTERDGQYLASLVLTSIPQKDQAALEEARTAGKVG